MCNYLVKKIPSTNTKYLFLFKDAPKYLKTEVYNLNSTNNGESSEKSHGAPNCRQNVNKLCCTVLSDFVKYWSVKKDSHNS